MKEEKLSRLRRMISEKCPFIRMRKKFALRRAFFEAKQDREEWGLQRPQRLSGCPVPPVSRRFCLLTWRWNQVSNKKNTPKEKRSQTYTFTRMLRSWTRFVREQELAFHSSGHEKPQKDSMGAFQAITIWVIPLLFKGQHYKPCMLFATVANCKVEYLKSGRLDIRFLDSLEPVLSYGWVAIVFWAVSARFGTTEEYYSR